ncbi:MAG: hypothetical protein P4L91_12200 [Burkholderiaceae bacterium]|nr:hypothetical protein [Burkholderiaceae bacterium]
MNNLAIYASTILQETNRVSIMRQETIKESWPDQGFEVRNEQTTYWFEDGAVIRRTVEQDTFPDDLACTESWITYEVIMDSQSQGVIEPLRKTFDNHCREAFWTRFHTS